MLCPSFSPFLLPSLPCCSCTTIGRECDVMWMLLGISINASVSPSPCLLLTHSSLQLQLYPEQNCCRKAATKVLQDGIASTQLVFKKFWPLVSSLPFVNPSVSCIWWKSSCEMALLISNPPFFSLFSCPAFNRCFISTFFISSFMANLRNE